MVEEIATGIFAAVFLASALGIIVLLLDEFVHRDLTYKVRFAPVEAKLRRKLRTTKEYLTRPLRD